MHSKLNLKNIAIFPYRFRRNIQRRACFFDASEKTTRLHTAHHLLLKALQIVLGSQVKQRGSNLTSERLRMDFANDAKMTDEQKAEAERIVNEKIAEDLPVIRSELAREEAEKLAARA